MSFFLYFLFYFLSIKIGCTAKEVVNINATNILKIEEFNGKKQFVNKYDTIDSILLQPELLDRNIVVVSIIGEYRKGKSFFLDYCLRFMYETYPSVMRPEEILPSVNWMGDGNDPIKGFSWKYGRKADTKGILFWPDVFLHDAPLGEKIAIILMDTQGLFEIGSTPEENARIFGLSTLISSVQIVNLKETIQENQIEYLEMATSLSKIILGKQPKGTQWKPFQKLLFLIRDWRYDDIEGGFGYGGGKTYFEEFLSTQCHQGTKAHSIRENIHGSFDLIDCFLLNFPGEEIQKKHFNGGWAKLNNDFVRNLKFLVESILGKSNLTKKSILGKVVTCEEYRDFVVAYFDAFRDTKFPEMENILELTINNELKANVEKQIKSYQADIRTNVDFNHKNFTSWIDEKHEKSKNETLIAFMSTEMLSDDENKEIYGKFLQNEIEKVYKTWKEGILNEYSRFTVLKNQIDTLNKTNAEYKKTVDNLGEKIKINAENNARALQEYERKLQQEKNQLQNLVRQVNDLNISNRDKENRIDKIYKDFENSKKKYDEELSNKIPNFHNSTEAVLFTTGRWVPWSVSKNGVPENAVRGGYDKDGPLYVMNAKRYWKGSLNFAAIPTGFYSPKRKEGQLAYGNGVNLGTIYNETYSEFELLTHLHYEWVDKSQANKKLMIEGGYNDKGDILYVAKNKPGAMIGNNYQYIGTLRNNLCEIYFNTKYFAFNDYEVLVRKKMF